MALETIVDNIILELESQQNVFNLPIKFSKRIKYTCFTVSKNYIIFGATSGGLYIFERNPYSFWQLIPSKESTITLISISFSENFIAFATNRNVVCVLEMNENSSCKPVMRADDLIDAEITVIIWDDDIYKPTLYIGDSEGRVYFLKLSFLNKNILHLPTTVLMSLDSRIVQLCSESEYLLASTITRCYLCNTVKEQFKQIGQQLRDGYFGTTFFSSGSSLRIFCARPGSRLWEVSLDCVVQSTHQFKGLLAIPPSPFISLFDQPKIVEVEGNENEWQTQSFNFIKLFDFLEKYVVAFNKNGLFVLNVKEVDVLFWNNCFGEISDVRCVSNSIFVWNTDGILHELVVLPVKKCLLSLYLKQCFSLCVEIISRLYEKVTNGNSLDELKLLCQLEYKEENVKKCEMLEKFKAAVESKAAQNYELNCGIHIVNNRHFSSKMLDDSTLRRKPRSLQRTDSEEIRRRSRSLPSSLKDEVRDCEENVINVVDGLDYSDSEYSYNNAYLETGLYNSPFLTLASYELLEECLNELSCSVSEKFNVSFSLREKWNLIEKKLKFLRKTRKEQERTTPAVSFKVDHEELVDEDEIQPVIAPRKRSKVDTDYTKIIKLCSEENAEVMDFMNLVVEEHKILNEKHKYEQFPFAIPSTYFNKAKILFNQFLVPEIISQWFNHINFPLCSDNFTESYPPLLREIYSNVELKNDFLLHKVLIIFSELIDPSTILETIKSLNFPCYYTTFSFIIKYFQNSEVSEQNHYLIGNRTHWPLPWYLNTMLLMIGLEQVDVFCEMGLKKNVQALDVIYLLLLLNRTEKDASKYLDICLTYIQKQFESGLGFCIFDNQTLTLAVKMFSLVNDKFDLCCVKCWFVLPDSQLLDVKFIELAKYILDYLWRVFTCIYKCDTGNLYSEEELLSIRRSINDTTEYEQYLNFCYRNIMNCTHVICHQLKAEISDQNQNSLLLSLNIICNFCHRVPQLWEHLSKLQNDSSIKILHMEHFVQLGNIMEFESSTKDIDVEGIRRMLKLKSKLSDGYCLNCESKIPVNRDTASWNEMAVFVLRKLGSKQCLLMLEEFSNHIVLESNFYRSLFLTSIPGITSDLAKAVLASVSGHSNVGAVSSEFADEFYQVLKRDRWSYKFSKNVTNTHHWGMSVSLEDGNQAICYSCSLPLFSKYLIKEDNGGIMVFSCSHTYHTVCLKNKNCNATCLVCDRFLR